MKFPGSGNIFSNADFAQAYKVNFGTTQGTVWNFSFDIPESDANWSSLVYYFVVRDDAGNELLKKNIAYASPLEVVIDSTMSQSIVGDVTYMVYAHNSLNGNNYVIAHGSLVVSPSFLRTVLPSKTIVEVKI